MSLSSFGNLVVRKGAECSLIMSVNRPGVLFAVIGKVMHKHVTRQSVILSPV